MENANRKIEFDLVASGINKLKSDIQSIQAEFEKIGQRKVTNNNISETLKSELLNAKNVVNEKAVEINSGLQNIGNVNNTGLLKFVDGYKQAIGKLVESAEKYNRLYLETGDQKYLQNYQELIPKIRQLSSEHDNLSRQMGIGTKQADGLSNALKQLKHHAAFAVTGGLLFGALSIPTTAVSTMADIEQQMAGMLQTLPQLYKDYPNHIKDQEALNKLTKEFIGIGQQYGQEVDQIIEAGKLWSRGYKDVQTVLALTHNTSKLAIADLMDLNAANSGVESVISAFHKQAEAVDFSNHVVDSYTNIAHNAQTSATDLSEAMKRSSSAAYQVGVSFDYVAAMAATLIKDSGQSGSIVGNSLKAIFSNIHSDKGIAELEKLGIAVFEFDDKGSKHFRNVESVFTELMIKMQGNSTNMEETMKKISGGSFQWGRASALFSDYNEFIKNYNLSINSSGVAEKQVMAQMDTLIRKWEQLKANLTGVIMGTSDAGLSTYLKSWLDSINAFLKGLQQISPNVYSAIGSMVKWSVAVYAVKLAIDTLDRSVIALTAAKGAMTTATAANAVTTVAETAAINAETAAMSRLGVATTVATGGLNLLMLALIAAGTGASIYAANVGDSVNQMELAAQKQKDLLDVKTQELEMTSKQTEFIGNLANAYVQFQGKLVATTGDETKAIEVKKSMQTTIEELTKLIGEEGVARLTQSNWSQEAIKAEQDAHSKASVSIKAEISEIKTAMDDFTNRQIDATQARIDSLYKETEALSIWRRAQLAAYDFYAGIMDKQIKFKTFVLNNMPSFMGSERFQLAQSLDSDISYRDSLKTTSRDDLRDDIAQAKAELARLKLQKYQRSTLGGSTGESSNSSSEVDEDTGKKKKKGNTGAGLKEPDSSDELFRLDKGREVSALFNDLKRSTDDYQGALDKLNTKQDIFGFSVDTTDQKLSLMNAHILDLIARAMEMESLSNDYSAQANDIVSNNETLVAALKDRKTSWDSLTKQEKQDLIASYKDYVQDEKNLLKLVTLADELKTKVADLKKDATKGANDTARTAVTDAAGIYDSQMRKLGYNKEYDTLRLGRFSTAEQQRVVNYRYALDELAVAEQRLKDMESSPHTEDEWLKQRNSVESLKRSVEELGDKFYSIRQGFAGMASDILLQNQSLGQVWKSQWNAMANDAIKAMFRIQNNTPSLLSQIFGLFGGVNLSGSRPAGVSGPTGSNGGFFLKPHTGGIIGTTNIPKYHSGGLVKGIKDDEQAAILQKGEVVINKDATKKILSGNLGVDFEGIPKGSGYVPYLKNHEAVQQAITVVQQQQNQNRITEQNLERQTLLMEQQNQMIAQMMNNGGNGGTTIAQPIVMKQDMSMEEFANLMYKAKRFNYI